MLILFRHTFYFSHTLSCLIKLTLDGNFMLFELYLMSSELNLIAISLMDMKINIFWIRKFSFSNLAKNIELQHYFVMCDFFFEKYIQKSNLMMIYSPLRRCALKLPWNCHNQFSKMRCEMSEKQINNNIDDDDGSGSGINIDSFYNFMQRSNEYTTILHRSSIKDVVIFTICRDGACKSLRNR